MCLICLEIMAIDLGPSCNSVINLSESLSLIREWNSFLFGVGFVISGFGLVDWARFQCDCVLRLLILNADFEVYIFVFGFESLATS